MGYGAVGGSVGRFWRVGRAGAERVRWFEDKVGHGWFGGGEGGCVGRDVGGREMSLVAWGAFSLQGVGGGEAVARGRVLSWASVCWSFGGGYRWCGLH